MKRCSTPRIAVLSTLVVGACAPAAPTPDVAAPIDPGAADAPRAPARPVVVALVIDQLPMWIAAERWKTLPKDGGFAKLIGEANVIGELRHGHAFNSTAPGHAALFSGGTSHRSGITSNARLDVTGAAVGVLSDASTRVVTTTGVEERSSSSLAALKLPTVADALRDAHPNAVIVSLSMKDRSALFGGGRKPDATLWFDAKRDGLVTSTAVGESIPAWATPFAEAGAGARYRSTPWVPLDPKWLATHTDLPAPDIGQGDFHGLGKKFPHDPAKATKPSSVFPATPPADTFLVDATLAAIGAMEGAEKPLFIALSLSATDYVSHVFGPDAPEAWDQMARLDQEVLRLLTALDRAFGPEGYAVVLSADHGGPPTPEVMNQGFCGRPDPDRYERRCEQAGRLHEEKIAEIAERAADAAVGKGEWILGASEPFVVLRDAARALPKEKLDTLVSAVVRSLEGHAGIARALDVRARAAACPAFTDDSVEALVCRSVHGATGGDIFIVPKPGVFFDAGYVEGDGMNHGTPYLFDRAVPIIVRRPRAPTADPSPIDGSILAKPPIFDQRAYAATLAAFLEVEPPEAAAGGEDLSTKEAR